MAGIFGYAPKMGGKIMDYDPSASEDVMPPMTAQSGLFATPEMAGNEKWGLILSGLADATGAIAGQEPKYFERASKSAEQNRLRAMMKGAFNPDGTVDWKKMQQVMLATAQEPGDFAAAAQVGQPKYAYEDGMEIVTPYAGGKPSYNPVEGYRPKAPSGYTWGADGALQYIPGGPGDPRVAGSLASARRKPAGGGGGGAPKPPTGFILD